MADKDTLYNVTCHDQFLLMNDDVDDAAADDDDADDFDSYDDENVDDDNFIKNSYPESYHGEYSKYL